MPAVTNSTTSKGPAHSGVKTFTRIARSVAVTEVDEVAEEAEASVRVVDRLQRTW